MNTRALGWGLQAGAGQSPWGPPCSPDDTIDHGGLVSEDKLGAIQKAGALGLAYALGLVVEVGALGAVAAIHRHGTWVALSSVVR